MSCACGSPVYIAKTGECRRCYNKRYAAEHRLDVDCACGERAFVKKTSECRRCYDLRRASQASARAEAQRREVVSIAVSQVPRGALDAAMNELVAAMREHGRATRAARAAAQRARDREWILLSKRIYREQNREAIRQRDAEYRARPEVAERRRAYSRDYFATERGREAAREHDRKRRQTPERKEAQRRYNAAWRAKQKPYVDRLIDGTIPYATDPI